MQSGSDICEQRLDELAYRENDGIEVSLLWNRADNSLSVYVADTRTGDSFELAVGSENPLEIFNHPYAHAAFRGIEYSTPETEPAYA